MATAFDLNLLPLARRAGQDQSSLPGLYVVNPPRRAARGRADDQLILYLALTGCTSWSSEQQTQLLARTAEIYYDTTGAVTTAARAAIEFLNQYLLERNLRAESGKRHGAGWFTLAVARVERLYLVQAGRMRVFTLAAEGTQEISDPESSGPGLGLARPPVFRYFQAELKSDAYILIAPVVPTGWQGRSLQGMYSQGLESMRRRLLGQAGADLAAVLIQTVAGEGKMRLLWPKAALSAPSVMDGKSAPLQPHQPALAQAQVLQEIVEPAPIHEQLTAAAGEAPGDSIAPKSEPAPATQMNAPEPAAADVAVPEAAASKAAVSEPVAPDGASLPDAETGEVQPGSNAHSQAGPATSPPPVEAVPGRRLNDQPTVRPARRQPPGSASPATEKLKTATITTVAAFGRALRVIFRLLGRLIKRILPDESLLNIPPSAMAFLAIAVPLVVSVLGGMIFIKRGLSAQAQDLYAHAIGLAQQARAQTDPMLQRAAWGKTLETVEQAADFDRGNSDIQALKAEASTALDLLDRVKRLAYRLALTEPINQSLNIVQMVATQDELYMLTDAQGSVFRALQTSAGYKPDETFNCGPNVYGTRAVGKLVDIVPLQPGGEFNATLLGIDSNANLLYCIPHERPKAIGLATPTTAGWGKTGQFAIDLDTQSLYVLDTVKNNVWIYENSRITDQPIAFFDPTIDEIPPLGNIVDMAVNRATLYLLHDDGQTTLCEFGRIEGTPNRCQSPVYYQDDRPGQQSGPVIDGALFSAIQYVAPPDPSIFMLNPATRSAYQFGVLQLNFYYQYRPQFSDSPVPEEPATAFAISPGRSVFLAFGSQVYEAKIVP
ncbi:MAG: hypothetical protein ACOYYS_01465 [Chloroflexota bacterium]